MTTCTDEARCMDFPLCRHARRGFSLDDGDTGATFWPPLCPPVTVSAPDEAGRQEGPIQALTEACSEIVADLKRFHVEALVRWERERNDLRGKVDAYWVELELAQAQVARLLAEIADRESERADLRDRVTKAEPALERVEAAHARSVESMGKQQTVWTLAELQDDLSAALKGES